MCDLGLLVAVFRCFFGCKDDKWAFIYGTVGDCKAFVYKCDSGVIYSDI